MYTPEEMEIIHQEVKRQKKEGWKPEPEINKEELEREEKEATKAMFISYLVSIPLALLPIYFLGWDVIYIMQFIARNLTGICFGAFIISAIATIAYPDNWLFWRLPTIFGTFLIVSVLNDMAMRHYL